MTFWNIYKFSSIKSVKLKKKSVTNNLKNFPISKGSCKTPKGLDTIH